jgi:hypothetical protein
VEARPLHHGTPLRRSGRHGPPPSDSLANLRRPNLSWLDLLDIGLVSFLIYGCRCCPRTRAAQMALSGGFLIGLFFLRTAAPGNRQLGDP